MGVRLRVSSISGAQPDDHQALLTVTFIVQPALGRVLVDPNILHCG